MLRLLGPAGTTTALWRVAARVVSGLVLSLGLVPAGIAQSAPGGDRVALVVGNAAYKSSPLFNTINDASGISELLKSAGFTVDLQIDASHDNFRNAVVRFGNQIRNPNVKLGIFYYAGHGMQLNSRNYLIPVNAVIKGAADVPRQSVDVTDLLRYMEQAKDRSLIVVLDACRDDPFSDSYQVGQKGLSPYDAPSGTLLAYATGPGQVALDGKGKNGLYTKHLLQELAVPGETLQDGFIRVRIGVLGESKGKQKPWELSSLVDRNLYLFPNDRRKSPDLADQIKQDDRESAEYRRIRARPEEEQENAVRQFLKAAPNGIAAEQAMHLFQRVLAEQIRKESAASGTQVAAIRPADARPEDPAAARQRAEDAARLEAARREVARLEAQQQEAAKREAAAMAAEKAAQARLVEQRALEQQLLAQAAATQRETDRREADRRAAERREAARLEAERQAAERKEAERRETERREAEQRMDTQRLARQREEMVALAAQKAEADKAAAQKAAERAAAEKAEQQRLAAATQAQERAVQAQREAERAKREEAVQLAAAEARAASAELARVKAEQARAEAARGAELKRIEDERAAAAAVRPVVVAAAPVVEPIRLPANEFFQGYDEHVREYRVGDEYEFRFINGFNGLPSSTRTMKVTAVDVGRDRVEYNNGEFLSDLMGNTVRNQLGEFDSIRQFYPANLYVGKQWRTHYKQSRPNGIVYTFRYDLKVVGRERVTVPAGTFDTYKIEARGINVELRATLERNIWVAPGVSADIVNETMVRLRDGTINQTDRQELVRYVTPGRPVASR